MVECTGLENRRTERYRGFESLSLRTESCKSKDLQDFFLIVYFFDEPQIWLSGNLVGISINLCKSIQKELFINDTP